MDGRKIRMGKNEWIVLGREEWEKVRELEAGRMERMKEW